MTRKGKKFFIDKKTFELNNRGRLNKKWRF